MRAQIGQTTDEVTLPWEQTRLANSRSVMDGVPGLVAILAPEGAVEAVNRQILEYTGQQLEELRQWGTNGTVHPEDLPHVAEIFTRSIAAGVPYEIEQRLRRFDGAYRWFQNRGVPARDASGRITHWFVLLIDIDDRKRAESQLAGEKHLLEMIASGRPLREVLGAVQDVTQRRLAEEALDKVRSELAHVTRVMSLGALTASIAHEVNQPLSGIITNANTCLRMLAADPPNVEGARETARRTIRDGNRASEVVARLRALFSKNTARSENVDLNEAAAEVLALLSSDFQRNRVFLRADFAHDLPGLGADRVQLQQVILNLLLNASDAMSAVDDRPRLVVIKTARDGGDRVRLSVQDAGVGVATEDAQRLFDAFYTTKSGGMGIGLSVSRSIIESHHGRLWCEPNQGPGATFAFSIPVNTLRVEQR